jgi:hypothetical protein
MRCIAKNRLVELTELELMSGYSTYLNVVTILIAIT